VALSVLSGTLVGSSPDRADASVVKYAHDDRGTGWYPDQTGLSPAAVSSGNFGRVWDAKVNGSVYNQPVLSQN